MIIDIKYAEHIDLIFHILAYMRVYNASDCFDQAYIDAMRQEKAGFGFDLLAEIKTFEQYYNDNFDRVMLIGFLPFYSRSFDELKEIYLNYPGFTSEDISIFIKPFVHVLEKEAVFYFDYWRNKQAALSHEQKLVENFLRKELNKYSCVFDYFDKSALAYLTISITKNGRGYNGIPSYFSALAPFPKTENDFDNTFFTLLHEYTHQFTDDLLKSNISMIDGSHGLSENLVILADYYLIKTIDNSNVEKYFKWISGNDVFDESDFLSIYKVDVGLETDLKNLLNKFICI